MEKNGKLIALEGIDDVGKSTVGRELASVLRQGGSEVVCHSFPGTISGTLGSHVYRLHHAPNDFGIASIDPSALQILHIAAHVDGIIQHIIPSLKNSDFVILDRYWWSTLAYGIAAGAHPLILTTALEAETVAWSGILPANLFLLTRNTDSAKNEVSIEHVNLLRQYEKLVDTYKIKFPIHIVPNDGPVSDTVNVIREFILNS